MANLCEFSSLFVAMIGSCVDKQSYQHRITLAKSPDRTEALGGILADDMGLGKSLSVLAAIAATLDMAEHHAQRVSTMSPEDVLHKPVPARCTLVLVPSTCKCFRFASRDGMLTIRTVLMISWRTEIDRYANSRLTLDRLTSADMFII